MLKKEKGSKITDEFLESFGKLYHAFKFFGLTPNEICDICMKILDVSRSSYQTYLRRARDKKFIVDNYKETREELNLRMQGKNDKVVDNEVKQLIFTHLKK